MARPVNKKFLKRYLQTLQLARGNPRQLKQLISQAPVPILKLLSNAAILASRGNIKLTPKQKQLFREKRKLFNVLTNRSIGFDKKRQYLVQTGGGVFIPVLLSAVAPLVSKLLFNVFGKTWTPHSSGFD